MLINVKIHLHKGKSIHEYMHLPNTDPQLDTKQLNNYLNIKYKISLWSRKQIGKSFASPSSSSNAIPKSHPRNTFTGNPQ